ncbi:MAG TPA: PfkB family carbohydrate kinase [Solirubrobacteraceae bacterium]
MITVAGEALIDIVVGASGSVRAVPGGGPFNVARTVAHLGGECQFLGTLSEDPFGETLRGVLTREGVRVVVEEPTAVATTVAIAQVDELGVADYRFYLDGTAAAQLEPGDVPDDLLAGSSALAVGGLGLVVEPIASTLRALVAAKPPSLLTLLDPNCRPRAVRDPIAYRMRIDGFAKVVHVVKVSREDLAMLRPGEELVAAARGLLSLGPAAVLVTDGPSPVRIITARGERSVPVPPVQILDTVGAGDAFVAACLVGWGEAGLRPEHLGDPDALAEVADAAVHVAAAACTVSGANLPARFRRDRRPVRPRTTVPGSGA